MSSLNTLFAALVAAGLGAAVLLVITAWTGHPTRWLPTADQVNAAGRSLQRNKIGLRLTVGVLVGVGVWLATGWVIAAAAGVALVLCWPLLFGGRKAEQHRIQQLEALASWTETLRDTMAAHTSLEQAIPTTAAQAPPSLKEPLTGLVGMIKARVPLDQALRQFAGHLDDASADLVIAALILNVQRRGDRLGQVLTGLAATAREEVDLRRRISAGRAELRRGVSIVVGMTISFAGFLAVFGGEYIRPYDTFAGQVALTVVIGMFATGFAWMRRLATGTTPEPLLTRPGNTDAKDQQLVIHLTNHIINTTATATKTASQQQLGGRS